MSVENKKMPESESKEKTPKTVVKVTEIKGKKTEEERLKGNKQTRGNILRETGRGIKAD